MDRKSNKPPRKRCPYGFTCSQMTSQLNIIAENCWFLKDCRDQKKDSNSKIEHKEKKIKQQILEVGKEIAEYSRKFPLSQRQRTKRQRLSQRLKLLTRILAHEKAVFELIEFGNS